MFTLIIDKIVYYHYELFPPATANGGQCDGLEVVRLREREAVFDAALQAAVRIRIRAAGPIDVNNKASREVGTTGAKGHWGEK